MNSNNEQDSFEISIDEIQKIIDEENEIEIDLDDFTSFIEKADLELYKLREKYRALMSLALSECDYHKAFHYAKKLKKVGYAFYKSEVDACYEKCAVNGVVESLIYEADKYTIRENGRIKPEAFRYLKNLSALGYIGSFRWLADCYYFGIGCETDRKKAERLYFEGMLFANSDYCRDKYARIHPDLKEYKGDDLIINLIKNIVFGRYNVCDNARSRIAELILDGYIKEYKPESAVVLLKEGWVSGGIDYLRLGDCVLNGIGVEPDLLVAESILEYALGELEYIVNNFSSEYARKAMKYSYHTEQDYLEAYEKAKSLLKKVQERIKTLNECGSIGHVCTDIDQEDRYSEWRDQKLMFIKRADITI